MTMKSVLSRRVKDNEISHFPVFRETRKKQDNRRLPHNLWALGIWKWKFLCAADILVNIIFVFSSSLESWMRWITMLRYVVQAPLVYLPVWRASRGVSVFMQFMDCVQVQITHIRTHRFSIHFSWLSKCNGLTRARNTGWHVINNRIR